MPLRWPTIAAVLVLAALGSAVVVSNDGFQDESTDETADPVVPHPIPDEPLTSPTPPPPLPLPAFDPTTSPRWIAAASGPVPQLNQVSLEQDIALAAEVLGPGGRVLFGAGPGTLTVQILAPPRELDPVTTALGELFSPRSDRGLAYRETRLVTAEPATADALLGALDHALAGGPEPLLLYLGGHGNRGDLPRHNTVSLWADSELSVVDLATRLDESPRPVRLVVTTCFSGGFADIVFRGADEALGPSEGERCGLFSAPWDLEATGCDPNPDRATHDGYGLHVLEALRGRDRQGKLLPMASLDLDGDGRISLLEAHTRARIASTSADVPTTTAERWLRHAAPSRGSEASAALPEAPAELPEEAAVITALAERLGFVGREAGAALELQRREADLEAVLRSLDEAQAAEDAAYRLVAADLLARWPLLDDPWHPDHARVLARYRTAITEHLERSATYADWLAARSGVDHLVTRSWELRTRAAPYERLVRAVESLELAARLHAQGGEGWATFERILACERSVP